MYTYSICRGGAYLSALEDIPWDDDSASPKDTSVDMALKYLKSFGYYSVDWPLTLKIFKEGRTLGEYTVDLKLEVRR